MHLYSSATLAFDFLLLFFFAVSLSGFGIRITLAIENEFGSVQSSAVFWNSLRRMLWCAVLSYSVVSDSLQPHGM